MNYKQIIVAVGAGVLATIAAGSLYRQYQLHRIAQTCVEVRETKRGAQALWDRIHLNPGKTKLPGYMIMETDNLLIESSRFIKEHCS